MELEQSLHNYLPSAEVDSLLKAMNEEPTHALLLNINKMSDEEFVSHFPNVKKHPFVEHAYLYKKEEYDFGKMLYYDDGVYSIQDASAMMAPYFLNPSKKDLVLDMCAAPGGKSIGCSLLMEGDGVIVSNDISYPRAKNLSQNIERMGLGNLIVTSTDFVFAYAHFKGCFDKILLDAPCSGSAMFRKDKQEEADWRYQKVKSCAKRQLELLELAYSMLKEGGSLCYSTCSFSYEEDEGSVLALKARHPDAILVDLPKDPSFYRCEQLPQAIHLFPHRFEGEGQFICLIKKPGTLPKTEFTKIENKTYKDFLSQYGLSARSNEILRGKFYSLSEHFDVSHLNILRYGVKLFEVRDIFIPDHHLSHYLSPDYSIKITPSQAANYIHGETFDLPLADGFYIVSYQNQNLGFIKMSHGVAKNHYPKGLRKSIKVI